MERSLQRQDVHQQPQDNVSIHLNNQIQDLFGYNNKGSYKIIAGCRLKEHPTKTLWTMHDFASNAWKYLKSVSGSVIVRKEKRLN
ncbi:unnamed protein product [Arabidopsis thaliana]|uniref:Uncharacterized protein n=1 Tax=Arabidopsis thaliana TaxID=3702 RepID=Q9LHT6_ARATH|nr:unnamed protein product [Arabidopsis thaliana]